MRARRNYFFIPVTTTTVEFACSSRRAARALFQATDAKAAAAADAGASKADPFSDVKILGSSAGASKCASIKFSTDL